MDRGQFLDALPWLQRLPPALEHPLIAALASGAETCGVLHRVTRVFAGLCCFLLPQEKPPESVLFFACAPEQDATQMAVDVVKVFDSE